MTASGTVMAPSGAGAPERPSEDTPRRTTATERAFAACLEACKLWHDQDGLSYATIPRGKQVEHLPLSGKRFDRWMRRLVYRAEGVPPRSQAIKDAWELLDTLAVTDGPCYPVHLRVARTHRPDRLYLDLGWKTHEAVEVSANGWQILPIEGLPVRFIRGPSMQGLPRPVAGGAIEKLRPLLNVDDRGFLLAVSWMLATLSGTGPYPILALSGEQGSAKTSTSRVLQGLTDPSAAGVRGTIREREDLYLAARNAHVLVLDNLSSLKDSLADDLCRISTGASFSKRRLYRDDEEMVISVCRPLIVNGIPDLVSRGDLADRCLHLSLRSISAAQRITQKEHLDLMEAIGGEVLGGLLTALSGALARWDQTCLAEVPRMADFARLIVAAEPDLPWAPGSFLAAYQQARMEAASITLEGDLFAEAIRSLLREVERWEGTATALYSALVKYRDTLGPAESWPRNPKSASEHLRRLAPALRLEGLQIAYERLPGGTRERMIRLEMA